MLHSSLVGNIPTMSYDLYPVLHIIKTNIYIFYQTLKAILNSHFTIIICDLEYRRYWQETKLNSTVTLSKIALFIHRIHMNIFPIAILSYYSLQRLYNNLWKSFENKLWEKRTSLYPMKPASLVQGPANPVDFTGVTPNSMLLTPGFVKINVLPYMGKPRTIL